MKFFSGKPWSCPPMWPQVVCFLYRLLLQWFALLSFQRADGYPVQICNPITNWFYPHQQQVLKGHYHLGFHFDSSSHKNFLSSLWVLVILERWIDYNIYSNSATQCNSLRLINYILWIFELSNWYSTNYDEDL